MNEQHSNRSQPGDENNPTAEEEQAEAVERSLRGRSIAAPVALDAAAGAAAGAVAGTLAGPVGMAVGAVIGGLVGSAAGVAVERADREKSEHEEELDRTIGVSGGDIGEARPGQLRSQGRFHAASLGVADTEPESSDGPIQNVDGA